MSRGWKDEAPVNGQPAPRMKLIIYHCVARSTTARHSRFRIRYVACSIQIRDTQSNVSSTLALRYLLSLWMLTLAYFSKGIMTVAVPSVLNTRKAHISNASHSQHLEQIRSEVRLSSEVIRARLDRFSMKRPSSAQMENVNPITCGNPTIP